MIYNQINMREKDFDQKHHGLITIIVHNFISSYSEE
jgi:hypothetical protein